MSWWELVLLGWAVAAGLQLVLYLIQLRTRDATAVDAGWGAGLVCAGSLYAALGDGDLAHRVLIAALSGFEFGRVAFVVMRRFGSGEDSRYAELRARWRARYHERIDDVRALGYDTRFERTWDFYLAFSEAAFKTGALRDVQLVLGR